MPVRRSGDLKLFRTPGDRCVEIAPIALAVFQVRLLEAGKSYVTPKYQASFEELREVMRGPDGLTVGELHIISSVNVKLVEWQGQHWAAIWAKDWVRVWDDANAEMNARFGQRTLEQLARDGDDYNRRMRQREAQKNRPSEEGL